MNSFYVYYNVVGASNLQISMGLWTNFASKMVRTAQLPVVVIENAW